MGIDVPLSEIIFLVMCLLAVAMISAALCRDVPIPFTVILVIIGVVLGSLTRNYTEVDFLTKLELLTSSKLTSDIVFFIFLPALIFESSFNLDARQLMKDIGPVVTLAVPALLIASFIIAFGLWYFLNMDFVLALLFGALISATDPVAVISLFKEIGAPQRLTVLVEGESLLNDATAIVLVKIILGLTVVAGFGINEFSNAIGDFLWVFLGGIFVGALTGFVIAEILYRLKAGVSAYLIMTIVLAYVSFIVGEHFLHVSGVMAVVAGAITMGIFGASRIPQSATSLVLETWEVIALVCNSLLFLLIGLSVELVEVALTFKYIVVAIVLVLLSRALTIFSIVPITVKLFRLPKITRGERTIMWWGGLKGGLAIAIVLSLPDTLADKTLLINMTLGVVLSSLLFNAPTIRPLIQRFGIDRLSNDERAELKHALGVAEEKASTTLGRFNEVGLISPETQSLIEKKTEKVFSTEEFSADESQSLRHLFIMALRVELEELKYLYDMGLLRQYTYLDMKNSLQRGREAWLSDPNKFSHNSAVGLSKPSIFKRLEDQLVYYFREKNWAAGILARYQHTRLSQSLQRDIASILIAKSVLEHLQKLDEVDPALRHKVSAVYEDRLQFKQSKLKQVRSDFPEFYIRFETRLFAEVAISSAKQSAEHALHHGEIGMKVYAKIEYRIANAIDDLPAISAPAPKLNVSDLIGTVPLLNGLSSELLAKLSDKAQSVTFLPKDVIIGEGERGDALYIISRGTVKVYKDREQTEELATLRDGDFFGETALLEAQIRTATVVATQSSTLIRLTRRNVLALAEQDPELKTRLTEMSDLRKTNLS